MKVLFVHKHHPIEPLGIGYVASSIAQGSHQSRLMLTHREVDTAVAEVSRVIEEYNPDILAQSIIFGSHLYAGELSRKIKAKHPGLVSILGGPAATFTPELIERGFDAICRYEGEKPFLEFCDALSQKRDVGNIPNIWVKENPALFVTQRRRDKQILDINDPKYKDDSGYDPERKRFVNATRKLLEGADLDAISAPDRTLLYSQPIFANGPIKHFMHTRGCAFKCTYCFNVVQNTENKGKGKAVRRRTHEAVVKEINEVRKKWPMELVYFQDDVFGPSYRIEDAQEFAEIYYTEVGLPFHAHVRFDLMKPEIARALAKAGCTGVHVAIEAGDDYIRNKIHRRGMSDKQILEGAAALRQNGIKMMTQNILGASTETIEQMYKTLEINIAVQPTFASASIFQPYPGTTALEIARDTGSLPARGLNDLIDGFGLESFYKGSILAMDPAKKRFLELFQKFFAIAVENPQIYQSGTLQRILDSYPQGQEADEALDKMYRTHRAQKDEELYGVKLRDVL